MKGRNIFKIILLFIVVVFSYFFMIKNKLLVLYGTNSLIYINLLPILLPINIYLLKWKKKSKFTYLFSIINGIFLLLELIYMVKGYLEFGFFLTEYFYLVVISYTLISSILNIKEANSLTNDLLICVISFFVIVIHVRYYLDNSFLHNLLNITDVNNFVLQNSYSYVTSYYGYFIIMFGVVLINQEIDSIRSIR